MESLQAKVTWPRNYPHQSPKNGRALQSLSCQGIGWRDFRAQLSAGDLRHASSGHHSCPKTRSGGMGWRSKIWRCLIFQMKKYIDDSPSLTIGFILSIPSSLFFYRRIFSSFSLTLHMWSYSPGFMKQSFFREPVGPWVYNVSKFMVGKIRLLHLNKKVHIFLRWSSVSQV